MSEQLLISLGVKDKGAKSQVTALNKELKTLDKEFKTTDKTMGTFEDATAGLGKKLDVLKTKYDTQKTKLSVYEKQIANTKEQIEQKKQAIETLSNAEGDNEKQIKKLTNEVSKMEQNLRQATREMSLTETELKALEQEMQLTERTIANRPFEKMRQDLQELGQGIENTGDKLQSLGQGLSSVGDTLLKMSAPVVGFGAYAIKASMDYESAMSEVKAISGATGEDLEKLENISKEMGRTTSKSAKESAEALKYMSLAGWNTRQMIAGLEPVLRLSEAGSIDLARASDLTTDSMSALGVQVEDLNRYLDIVVQSQAKANTSADGLMEAYIGCGGTLKNLNVPLEESATWLGILANRGVKGSEAGNKFNSVLVNLMGTSGQAKDALATLGVSAWDADGNFKGIEGTLRELDTVLASCTKQQKSQFEAMIGGKTQMDTLQALLSGLNEEYVDLRASITDSDGALLNMAETMQDNTKGNITRLKSELEGLGIQVGEKLLPHVNEFIGSVSELINWFGNLDEATQQNIMKMGLFAFAGGSTLKVLGNLTSGIGSTVSGLGKLVGNFAESKKGADGLGASSSGLISWLTKMAGGAGTTSSAVAGMAGSTATATGATAGLSTGLAGLLPIAGAVAGGVVVLGGAMLTAKTYATIMGESCITASDELGVFESIINKLTGSTVRSREELEQAGLIAKGFAENVGEEFQTKVLEAEKNINGMTQSLREFNLDGTFKEGEIADFKSRVDTTVQTAIDTIKGGQATAQQELKELLMADGVIDETEQKTLDFLARQSETQTTEVTNLQGAIYTIMEQGLADKGFLNEQEITQIEEHLANIASIELQSQATNQEELLASQADFLARVKTMDVSEATALLQEKATLRDTEMEDIRIKYDTQIEMLKLKNATASEEERIANEATIASLEKSKEDAIAIENEKYDSYLAIIAEKNPEILNNINILTGEELSNTDKKKNDILNKYKTQYKDMNSITKSGMYEMLNETTGQLDKVYINVDSNTKKITGAWSESQRKAGGLTKDMAKDADTMGNAVKSASNLATDQLKSMDTGFVNSKGQIVDANGKIVKSLEEFKTQADGTGQGILDLNGKKISIKTNTNGEIQNFKDFKSQLNSIKGSSANSYVNVYYREYNKPAGVSGVGSYNSYGGYSNYSLAEPAMAMFSTPAPFSLGDYSDAIMPMDNVASLFDNVLLGGGYFSPSSRASNDIKTTISAPKTVNAPISPQSGLDVKELAKEIATAVALAIQGISLTADVTLDSGALVGEISNGLAQNTKRRR